MQVVLTTVRPEHCGGLIYCRGAHTSISGLYANILFGKENSSTRARQVTKTFPPLNKKGQAKVADVTVKEPSLREAVARGRILMSPHTLALIQEGRMPKGDVFSVARVAGSMAAKKTGELIPMCHPLALTYIEIRFDSSPEREKCSSEAG